MVPSVRTRAINWETLPHGGGPSGAYRYQIPRDADRYFGVVARVNF